MKMIQMAHRRIDDTFRQLQTKLFTPIFLNTAEWVAIVSHHCPSNRSNCATRTSPSYSHLNSSLVDHHHIAQPTLVNAGVSLLPDPRQLSTTRGGHGVAPLRSWYPFPRNRRPTLRDRKRGVTSRWRCAVWRLGRAGPPVPRWGATWCRPWRSGCHPRSGHWRSPGMTHRRYARR